MAERAHAADIDLQGHYAMAFCTPFVAYPWPDNAALNEELRGLVLGKERNSAGLVRSNVGGWHSDVDFFQWDVECVRQLRDQIGQLLKALTSAITLSPDGKTRTFNYRLDGWANISRDRSYNSVHNHPNCVWSGVYYVGAGEPEGNNAENGKLELLDPRIGANMMYIKGTVLETRYLIDPLPGLMVMFPSWLSHMVHPFFGKGERISIAFNIVTTEVPSPTELA